jgi:hypothetical protein
VLNNRKYLPFQSVISTDILYIALEQYNGSPSNRCLTINYFYANTPNIPVPNSGGIGMILTVNTFIRIIFFMATYKDIYTNVYTGNSNVWSGWEKISA